MELEPSRRRCVGGMYYCRCRGHFVCAYLDALLMINKDRGCAMRWDTHTHSVVRSPCFRDKSRNICPQTFPETGMFCFCLCCACCACCAGTRSHDLRYFHWSLRAVLTYFPEVVASCIHMHFIFMSASLARNTAALDRVVYGCRPSLWRCSFILSFFCSLQLCIRYVVRFPLPRSQSSGLFCFPSVLSYFSACFPL